MLGLLKETKEEKLRKEILKYLKGNPGSCYKEVGRGVNPYKYLLSEVQTQLDYLESEGKIEHYTSGFFSSVYLYRIVK